MSCKMALLVQCCVTICVFALVVQGEKRLLLSDPDVVNNRLLQMEREIQRLTAELRLNQQDATNKMASLTAELKSHKQDTINEVHNLTSDTTNKLASFNTELESNKRQTTNLASKIVMLEQSSSGAVYTRWGRRTCPANGTELVYTGYAAGGMYDQSGSAAEYVCLPHDPNLITNVAPTNPYGATTHIYGAEYEDNVFGSNVFNNDVPCAVCHSTLRSSVLMIPGRNHCNNGWKFEYNGKLASGFEGHPSASQYVCVDSNPEVFERSGTNNDGKLFYPVRARCGSLPCPPYINDAFLTCVVCSK